VASLASDVILLMPPAVAGAAAEAGLPFVPEGYVDLDYDADGKIVIERAKKVRDPQEMGEKAVRLLREGKVRTVEGRDLELEVESICVHGDAPNAPEIAAAIRKALEAAGMELAPLSELHTIAR
jgi:5-oxoprolinase (ATP-hydrolysing) subunit A